MKKSLSAVLSGILLLLLAVCASAQIASTGEPTAGNSVYIAGNPDFFPIEYYDSETESYLGLLPEIYSQISENTGIEFSYVSSGNKNRQQQLAKNNQVEIISAHIKGEIENLADEYILCSFEKDGEKYTVCIGFTEIASSEISSLVKKELEKVDDSEFLSLALGQTASPNKKVPVILLVLVVLLLLISASAFIILIVKIRRENKQKQQNKLIDPLTGIGNGDYFRYCFDHYISPASRTIYYVAYIAIEVQRIEKYFGTSEAEELQIHAAKVLSTSAADTDFTARITDGVFAFVFESPDENRAEKRISEILEKLNRYEEKFFEEYRTLFRAGIFSLGTSNATCETALYNARQGYNYAAQNKLKFCFSNDKILSSEALKVRIQRRLADAVKNNEFKLYLQFIVNTKSRKICGAEALSRWYSSEEGLLSPANYIEAMQAAGIIDRLDFYIFEECCRLLEIWNKSGNKDLYLSCNFTRITMSAEDFMERFKAISERYTFDRKNLVLELTEDSLFDDEATARRNIIACKNEGYRIALDDFGSGYTAFSDICDYPIDIIKIDKHIVEKSITERGNVMLKGICTLAHNLGVKVLCEGVENSIEDKIVREANCDFIQGFYYSRTYPEYDAIGFYQKKRAEEQLNRSKVSEIKL